MDLKRPRKHLGLGSYKTHKVNLPEVYPPGFGVEFRVFLPAYLALRFFINKEIKDFRLRSNVQNFDKFDDLLIDIEMENGLRHHLALQLKHKQSKNLTPDSFYTGKDFNLEKYCAAYHEKPSDEYDRIIYTNANFDPKKVKDVKNFKMISCEDSFPKDFLDTSDKSGNVYKFEVNENTKKGQNFEKFFQHFSLFVCQKNSTDLSKEIENIFKIEYSAKDDTICTKYINLFRKWHQRQFTNNALDRKTLSIHLVDLLLGNFIPSKGTIYRNEKLNLLEESVRMFDVTVIEDSELKLVEELGKYEDENCLPFYIQEILEKYAKELKTNKESVILRLAKEYKFIDKFTKELEPVKKLKIFNYLLGKPLIIYFSENSKHRISKVLQMDFKENVHIKFVLVGKEIDSKQFGNVKSFNNLQDLFNSNNNLYQKVIDEIDISLQGREKIKLEKIITSLEDLPKIIQVKHLFQKNLMFGRDLEKLPVYNIPRTLSVVILDERKVLKCLFKENYFLMIDYGDEEDYVKSFAQRNSIEMINVEELINKRKNINTIHKNYIIVTNDEGSVKKQYDQICSMTDRNVIFLKINKPGEFLLIKSRNNHITGDLIEETESPFYFSKGVNVLCAEPGMGKTTTMKTIRNSCSSDYWTIFVELKQFDSLFKKDNLKTYKILNHFFNKFKEDAMSREVRKIFLSKRKVALFLDGLDEVNFQCIDNVLEFIRKLKEEGFHVWVASRNNLREKIETKLNQFSINIIEVNEEQQRQYITNRLSRDNKYSQDEINEIIKSIFKSVSIKNNCNILGIPLQLFVVTQMFVDHKEDNLELNDKLFVLTKLYTSYFEGKIKHELRKGGQTDEKYIEEFTKFKLKQYQILGLRSTLKDEDWKKLNLPQNELKEKKEFVEEIEKKGDYYGIVENVNEDKIVVFVHHTHAEYFAAVYLSENFDKVRMLGESFLTEKYDNLRLLFDIKLAENNPLHLSVIYKNLDEFDEHIKNFDSKDNGGRTPLHLACLYATRYSSSIDFFEEVKEETDSNMKIVDKLLESYLSLEQDEVFKWNCIEYASKYWCLYPLEAILKKYKQISSDFNLLYESNNWQNNQNFSNKDNTSLAYYASCLGYNNLLTNLIANNGLVLNELKYDWDRKTLLHYACKNGHDETAKLLIENNVDVNSVTLFDFTSLHYACVNGHNEIAKLLIENNANVNSVKKNGDTPLHDACRNEHYETAKLLIEHGADVNSINENGNTPLHYAFDNGHNEIAKLLIDNNANLHIINNEKHKKTLMSLMQKNPDIREVNVYSNTSLHDACKKGWKEIALGLIQNNADLNWLDEYGYAPLHYASIRGHNKIAFSLIEHGADVNVPDKNGNTALHYACKIGRKNIVDKLIETKADLNCVNEDGYTPLHCACLKGHINIALSLIEITPDVNIADKYGNTILHYACENGYSEIVDSLIQKGANVNSVNKNGNTPLHYVCQEGYKEIATWLIEKGANINSVNKDGYTPLYYACGYGYKYIANLLIENKADVNSIRANVDTPLHYACSYGQKETANLLISKKADVNSVNEEGDTPLFYACKKGHHEIALKLMKNGAFVDTVNKNGDTPLHYACLNGLNNTVNLLIERHADVNSVDKDGYTPLLYACEKEHNEIALKLIESNADVNAVFKDGNTLLHYACKNGLYQMASLLIRKKADVNGFNKNSDTPLHYACRYGHEKITYLLIDQKANVDSVNKYGDTSLHYACKNGYGKIAKLLIEKNAKVDSVNKYGDTPLHYACRYGHNETAKLLIENGANVNSINNIGDTPLHYACRNGHNESAKLLIDNNANLNSINKYGDTPLHYASKYGHEKIVCLLSDKMEDVNHVTSNKDHYTPLLYACEKGYNEIALKLFKSKADLKSFFKDGNTILHYACKNGLHEVALSLIQTEINVNIVNEHYNTPLHYACEGGHHIIVDLLINKGADVNSENEYFNTPLHYACEKGHKEIVRLLMEHNADVNSVNEGGYTSLHYACKNGYGKIAKLLIEKNAKVDSVNKYGDTPLHYASRNGHNEIAKLLIDRNADVNRVNNYGDTPLHYACKYGHNETAKLLIENNAKVDSVNKYGDTPLHYASRNEHNEIEKLLTDREADVNIHNKNDDTSSPLPPKRRKMSC